MSYSAGDFEQDAVKTARALHISYRRCTYLLNRWWAGMNNQFPVEQYGDLHNLMNRVSELVQDYEADSNAKLNTVMAKSDLTLPGDI